MSTVTHFEQTTQDIKRQTIIAAAQEKFGQVIECHNNIVLIKRAASQAPIADKPYMTIEGGVQEGRAAFYFGHYDMSFKDASADFLQRSGQTVT